jgi:signal transduction histidine kinase
MSDANSTADYSLRILWSLARWIEDKKGRQALETIARDVGVRAEDFDGSTHWVSHAQFERILELGLEAAGSEEAFKAACSYRFKESYGAFRYMMWGLSQQQICEAAAKYQKVVTSVGRFEVLLSERTRFHARYFSDRPESRLLCQVRQVGWTIGPTIWGLPPIQLEELACIARGDPYCEYHLRWFERTNVLPPVAGGLLGGAAAFAAASLHASPSILLGALPLVGILAGLALELRRTGRVNLAFAREVNLVVRDLGQSEAETRAEIIALQDRQREWIRIMEQQVAERTNTLERVVQGLDGLQQARVSTLRGFSHDLRNPLFVLRGNTQFLREHVKGGPEAEALEDMETASIQIEQMLQRLLEVATQDSGGVKLTPKKVAIAALADTLRRRLRALVFGCEIKASVFCTREAPEEIEIDPVVLDRIVDNLLTNAAKYTLEGSIVLEITGTPGSAMSGGQGGVDYLTLKVSDTGRGMEPDQVEKVFRPRASSEGRSSDSWGIGLSSTVRLLAQIGGRLDVMSKPGLGTTFWAHLPTRSSSVRPPASSEENFESMVTHVVTVRKAENS